MTFASPYPEVEIPDTGVYDYLFGELSDADANRVALVDAPTGTELTYRGLITRIDAFAAGLADRGIGVGDVVGLLSPNSSGFAVAFHGILRAGATATTINALFTAKDIATQLTDAHATMLITVSALLPQAAEGAAHAGLSPSEVVVLDGAGEAAAAKHLSVDDLLASGADAPMVSFDAETHLAALPYSSGTTGNPKGVMLTHRNLVANVAQFSSIQGITADDVIIAVLPFFHIYGMSELSPVSHCMPFDGGEQSVGVPPPLSSVGWTVPNAVSKIINPETGAEIGIPESGRSETGELWFSGPNVMAGYLGNDKATSETIDGDGFLHTGDMACVDSTGCVYIVDRLKELIKYKGYQVPPAELEALLLTHPGIADAAVIGVTDADGEEIPKAFVVKQSDAALDEEQVMAFVADNVAPYKKVRRVEFIDAIPKSASGKILRKDLRG